MARTELSLSLSFYLSLFRFALSHVYAFSQASGRDNIIWHPAEIPDTSVILYEKSDRF